MPSQRNCQFTRFNQLECRLGVDVALTWALIRPRYPGCIPLYDGLGTPYEGWYVDNVYVDSTLISDGSDAVFMAPEIFPR